MYLRDSYVGATHGNPWQPLGEHQVGRIMMKHVETLTRRPRFYLWETWCASGAGEVCRWLLWPHGHGLTWAVCGWAGTCAENTSLEDLEVWSRITLIPDFNILFNIMYVSLAFGPCYMLLQLLSKSFTMAYVKIIERIHTLCSSGCCESSSWQQDKDTKKFFENRNLKNLKTLDCRFRLEHSFEGPLMDQLYRAFSNCVWIIQWSHRNLAGSLKETHRGLSRRSLGRCRLSWAWFVFGSHRPQSKRCWISLLNSQVTVRFVQYVSRHFHFNFTMWQVWALAFGAGGLGVTVRIFEVMMKCAEKQPLGQFELDHGVHRTLKTVLVQPARSASHVPPHLMCSHVKMQRLKLMKAAWLWSLFREPFSKAARAVQIEVKSGLLKEILEDLRRL